MVNTDKKKEDIRFSRAMKNLRRQVESKIRKGEPLSNFERMFYQPNKREKVLWAIKQFFEKVDWDVVCATFHYIVTITFFVSLFAGIYFLRESNIHMAKISGITWIISYAILMIVGGFDIDEQG